MSINIQDLTSTKVGESFPNVLITKPNETLPVIARCLEKGDMQLMCEHNGVRKCVAKISPSAINIDWLLRTCGSIEYVMGEGVSTTISDVESYLWCLR